MSATTEDNICTCCKTQQEEIDEPYRQLKPLLRSTPNLHLLVALCEYCDGPAYRLGRRKDNEWFDPDNLDD